MAAALRVIVSWSGEEEDTEHGALSCAPAYCQPVVKWSHSQVSIRLANVTLPVRAPLEINFIDGSFVCTSSPGLIVDHLCSHSKDGGQPSCSIGEHCTTSSIPVLRGAMMGSDHSPDRIAKGRRDVLPLNRCALFTFTDLLINLLGSAVNATTAGYLVSSPPYHECCQEELITFHRFL
ncbi:hypothetical protein V5799_003244 [Amblyomma americanum]|uniref:Uncharacterized protein n=1 Tax=Amblyomma americanum TaxID=6943 RepID=A0AAQ4D9H9_AMBAM